MVLLVEEFLEGVLVFDLERLCNLEVSDVLLLVNIEGWLDDEVVLVRLESWAGWD